MKKSAFALTLLVCFSVNGATSGPDTASLPSPPGTPNMPSSPNGCGTGWNRYLVPDSIPVLQCDLHTACNSHDVCYAKCETTLEGDCEYRRCRKDGDLQGNAKCKTDLRLQLLNAKAVERRLQCDISLAKDIQDNNSGKWVCKAFALIYREAVKNWGEDAFLGASQAGEISQSRESYEAAIKEFFKDGTEAQFRALVESAEAGKPMVDMKKDIDFTPESGLVNIKQE